MDLGGITMEVGFLPAPRQAFPTPATVEVPALSGILHQFAGLFFLFLWCWRSSRRTSRTASHMPRSRRRACRRQRRRRAGLSFTVPPRLR